MGIYDNHVSDNTEYDIDEEAIRSCMEMELYSEIASMPDKERHMLLESPEYADVRKKLIESGLINKISILKLSKNSDLERRNSQAVMTLARQSNDPLYARYVKLVAAKNELKEQLGRRYGAKAALLSKKSQREYIKANPIGNFVLK